MSVRRQHTAIHGSVLVHLAGLRRRARCIHIRRAQRSRAARGRRLAARASPPGSAGLPDCRGPHSLAGPPSPSTRSPARARPAGVAAGGRESRPWPACCCSAGRRSRPLGVAVMGAYYLAVGPCSLGRPPRRPRPGRPGSAPTSRAPGRGRRACWCGRWCSAAAARRARRGRGGWRRARLRLTWRCRRRVRAMRFQRAAVRGVWAGAARPASPRLNWGVRGAPHGTSFACLLLTARVVPHHCPAACSRSASACRSPVWRPRRLRRPHRHVRAARAARGGNSRSGAQARPPGARPVRGSPPPPAPC
jgi:hypothetical protein